MRRLTNHRTGRGSGGKSSTGTIHIIGGGLAGLACGVALTHGGCRVVLHEATRHAGGRCRSYQDAHLGRRLDNGNHLLLSGNHNARRFLNMTGGAAHMSVARRAIYPFFDLRDGARWIIHPNRGVIPWWVFCRTRRARNSRPADYLALLKLGLASSQATVSEAFPLSSPLYQRLWDPLAVGVLNTPPDEAAARLLWTVIVRTFARGEHYCRPCHFPSGLGTALIDPAVAFLEQQGAIVHFGHRLKAVISQGERATALGFGHATLPLHPADRVVLAVPPAAARALDLNLNVPPDGHPIINIHFRLPRAITGAPEVNVPFLGLIGGLTQWIFLRRDVVSVTVSTGRDVAHHTSADLATRSWAEVRRALNISDDPLPPWKVIKEKHATFSQTPASLGQRQSVRTDLSNVFAAGDWTNTGLPATIEGAISSGFHAAHHIHNSI